MVSLEQVRLLESKVLRTIEYIRKVTGENVQLKDRLNSCQQRIDELEILVHKFKEDQSKIEDGILSALDKLNQFEDAIENAISGEKSSSEEKTTPENPPSAKPKQKSVIENEEKIQDESDESKAPLPDADDQGAGELDIF